MGIAVATLALENPKRPDLKPLKAEALADSGSMFLCIPETVRSELQLEQTAERRTVSVADGRRVDCPYVGPVQIRFENRSCFVGAIVLGEQVLLGAVPMEDMDLVVVPLSRRVMVNPLHPDIAHGRA
jgi:clan AA aspartic protease